MRTPVTRWTPVLVPFLVVELAIEPASWPAEAMPTPCHVRPMDRALADVVDEGRRRSATFRDLLAALETSDVFAYVQMSARLPREIAGSLDLVGATDSVRYVRVFLNIANRGDTRVWVLAHELQHAVEIAAAPEVRTEGAFRALFRRIGKTGGAGRMDTRAAQEVGARVQAELALPCRHPARTIAAPGRCGRDPDLTLPDSVKDR